MMTPDVGVTNQMNFLSQNNYLQGAWYMNSSALCSQIVGVMSYER